jgi:hypothetical protein
MRSSLARQSGNLSSETEAYSTPIGLSKYSDNGASAFRWALPAHLSPGFQLDGLLSASQGQAQWIVALNGGTGWVSGRIGTSTSFLHCDRVA